MNKIFIPYSQLVVTLLLIHIPFFQYLLSFINCIYPSTKKNIIRDNMSNINTDNISEIKVQVGKLKEIFFEYLGK